VFNGVFSKNVKFAASVSGIYVYAA
jgi:hypothetical protein